MPVLKFATKKSKKPQESMGLFDAIGAVREDLQQAASSLDDVIAKMRARSKRVSLAERAANEGELAERQRQEALRQQAHDAHVSQVTSMDLPLSWENAFFGNPVAAEVHADSISDGLVLSLNNLGRVDIEYIASITGESCKTVIQALKGSIYQNPETWEECFYKGWETAEEYLSGRLMRKYQKAKEANSFYNGYFEANVEAIERVLPDPVPTADIYVTLGSPWVPSDIIDEFIEALFGTVQWTWGYVGGKYRSREDMRNAARVRHDVETGTWYIPEKNRYKHSVAVASEYGTQRMEALHILERTLNMKPIVVTDQSQADPGKKTKKRVVNQSETMIAQEKQRKLVELFQKWVWRGNERAERLRGVFERNYSCVRRRRFDGQFLTFPTMAPGAHLYPFQKDAVARILFSPNTLLAHDVGSGKTYVMAAAGMELLRMGLSSKNLYVVPNNIVGQWRTVFAELYPNANILCVEPNTFVPSKRKAVLERIRDNAFDAIVMAYSCFEQIPVSAGFYLRQFQRKKREIERALEDLSRSTPQVKKKGEAVAKKIDECAALANRLDDAVFFDELGITRLFVDEAHNFKNVPTETQMTGVLGLSTAGSKRCQDMMDKVRIVQQANGGGGVVMATGTPITNSITDIYVMQQYLQSGELALLDLQSFDSWVGMFAEQATGFEIDVDTSSYRMATRLATFHNLPELTSLLASIADFHQVDQSLGIPLVSGRTDAVVPKSEEFSAYLKTLSARADKARARRVDPKTDNMLKITTDGRKAALDMRLVDPDLPFTSQSKVARCAENVYGLYVRTAGSCGAQLVFCDTSTPKAGFNLYHELKRLLVDMGVPEDQIAFVHDAASEKARSKLFSQVRKGNVRVLVGSTFKLGLGVNVQDKLVALHHLDVPWRPADMTQREGRILRQGNENAEVELFRYVTEGSFDAYSWQLLETKQRFISELLSGSLSDRMGSDVDDAVLDYAEVKALAVGNPLVKDRVEAANTLARFRALQAKTVEARLAMERELSQLPGQLLHQRELVEKCAEDEAFAAGPAAVAPESESKEGKLRRQGLRQQVAQAVAGNAFSHEERSLFEYRGFTIVLPANMAPQMPFVWVQRAGRYRVELGQAESGIMRRIDNCIDGFEKRCNNLANGLFRLEERERSIRAQLAKGESYAEDVEHWQAKVAELDEQLGVRA